MKLFNILILYLVVVLGGFYGCADSKDFESVEIEPKISNSSDNIAANTYVCQSTVDGYRLFEAVGKYSDGSSTDLTEEVQWSSDATDDTILSDEIAGLVYCNSDWGILGVKVTYSLSTSDSSSTSDSDTTDYTDSILVSAE